MSNPFGDAPVSSAPSREQQTNPFGDSLAPYAQSTFSRASSRFRADEWERAKENAREAVRRAREGFNRPNFQFTETGAAVPGPVSSTPVAGRDLSADEADAVYLAALSEQTGIPVADLTPQTLAEMEQQIVGATAAGNNPIENLGLSFAQTSGQLATGVNQLVAEGAGAIGADGVADFAREAAFRQEAASRSLPANMDSVSGMAGQLGGTLAPLVLGPTAAAGILGGSQFGQSLMDSNQRRRDAQQRVLDLGEQQRTRGLSPQEARAFDQAQRDLEITRNQELTAAALQAAAEFAGERVGGGAIVAGGRRLLQGRVKNALATYAATAGINATEEVVTQLAQNAVDRVVLDQQDQQISEGVGRAAILGAAGGVVGLGAQQGVNAVRSDLPRPSVQPDPTPVPQIQTQENRSGEDAGGFQQAVNAGVTPPPLPDLVESANLTHRVNDGAESRGVPLEFTDPIAKALYSATQRRKGRVGVEATRYLEQQGYELDLIAREGQEVRDWVEQQARRQPAGQPLVVDRGAVTPVLQQDGPITDPARMLPGPTPVEPAPAPVQPDPNRLPRIRRRDVQGQESLFLPDHSQRLAAIDAARQSVQGFEAVRPTEPQQIEAVEAFRRRGVEIVYFNGPAAGFRVRNNPGVIFVNSRRKDKGLQEAVMHEFGHELAASRPDLFNAIRDALPPAQRRAAEEWYTRAFQLRRPGQQPASLQEEGVTVPLGLLGMDQRVWREAMGRNPTLLERVREFFGQFIQRMFGGQPPAALRETVDALQQTLTNPIERPTNVQRSPAVAQRDERPSAPGAVINIGLDIPADRGGGNLSPDQARARLREAGVQIVSDSVQTSDTEQTLVAELDRPLTAQEAESLSADLQQEAVAQRLPDGTGELYGPMAEQWRPFNPEFFVMPEGQRASDQQEGIDLLPEKPPTGYGYWFTGDRFIVVDSLGNHDDVAFDEFGGSDTRYGTRQALRDGYVRIVDNGSGEFSIEYSSETMEAVERVERLRSDIVRALRDGRDVVVGDTTGGDVVLDSNNLPGREMAQFNELLRESRETAQRVQDTTDFLPETRGNRDERFAPLSTVELRKAVEDLQMFDTSRPDVSRRTVLQIAKQLQTRTRRIAGKAKSRVARIDRFVAAALREMDHQLTRPNSGLDWYDENLGEYQRTMRTIRPELRDETEWRLFSLILGKMSQGNKPFPNLVYADRIYRKWRQTGEIPLKQADGKNWPGNAIADGLMKIDRIVADRGREEAVKWFLTEHPVGEINDYTKSLNLPGAGNVPGGRNEMAYGVMVLGPKIGPFALMVQNIDGVTVKDLWFSRTWNRIQGTLVERRRVGGEMQDTIVDAPRNNTERAEMEEAMEKVAEIAGISPKSAQAVLWFYEKELYNQQGSELDLGNYADAAQDLSEGRTYGTPDPVVDPQPDRDVPQPRRARTPEDGGQAAQGGTADQEVLFLPTAGELTRSRGDLPQSVAELNTEREGSITAEARQAKRVSADLSRAIRSAYGIAPQNLPAVEAARMNDALLGKVPMAAFSDPDVRAALRAMRDHIDTLSGDILDTDLISEEMEQVIGDNLGRYLNRSYRIFDNGEDWVRRMPLAVKANAVRFIEGQLEASGQDPSLAPTVVEELLEDWKQSGANALFRGGRLGAKNLSILKGRKDIAPEMRALMGEYTNPFVNYAKTVTKQASLLANHRFLDAVKRVGEGQFLFTDETAPSGYTTRIAAPASSSMSPLNGMRTSPEIAQAFERYNQRAPQETWLRAVIGINNVAKTSKTVFSLMTHARNLLGQGFFWLANAHNPLHRRTWDAARTTWMDLRNRGDAATQAYVNKLYRLGIFGTAVKASEIHADLKDLGVEDMVNPFLEQTQGGIARAWKRIIDWPTKVYAASDHFGKVVGFEAEKRRQRHVHPDWSDQQVEKEAAKRTLDTYPTYTKIPPAIQKLRRQPFTGPFMSFWWEMVRTTGNAARYAQRDINEGRRTGNSRQVAAGVSRHLGLFGALTAPAMIGAIGKVLSGVGDEEEDDVRLFLPSWDRDSDLLITQFGDGKATYINLSHLNPYSGITDPLIAASNAETLLEMPLRALRKFVSPLVDEALMTKAVIDVTRNAKAETGAQVYNPEDTWDEIMQDVGTHLAEPLEPGTLNRARRRLIPAAMGEETSYGDKLDVTNELVAEFGLKTRSVNFETAIGFKVREMNEVESLLVSELNREMNRPGATQEKILREYRTREARRFAEWQKMRSMVEAVLRSGKTDREVFDTLVGNGMGQQKATAIMRNVYMPADIVTPAVRRAAERRGRDNVPLEGMRDVYQNYSRLPLSNAGDTPNGQR